MLPKQTRHGVFIAGLTSYFCGPAPFSCPSVASLMAEFAADLTDNLAQ
jgi:hypothetical protein